MIKVNDPKKAFVTKIESLYDIESQLEKALPKLAKASASADLKQGFEQHLKETKEHKARLEEIFSALGVKPKKTTCEGIRGIIADGEWVMGAQAIPEIKDGMIAGAARYAEHYEMAGYLSAIAEAKLLGLSDIASLLKETLKEEEKADKIFATAVKKTLGKA